MKQPDALMFSLATEVPLVLLVARHWAPDWRRLAVTGLCATLLTHPFAWWSFRLLRPHLASFSARAVIIEVTVACVEALLYAKLVPLSAKRALILGFLANAFSFGLGMAVAKL
jgi:hypothetical protein